MVTHFLCGTWAVNSCVTYGYLSGVIQLDTAMKIEFEADAEDCVASSECWSLRNLLKKVTHKEKSLFRAISALERGAVMAIVCSGN